MSSLSCSTLRVTAKDDADHIADLDARLREAHELTLGHGQRPPLNVKQHLLHVLEEGDVLGVAKSWQSTPTKDDAVGCPATPPQNLAKMFSVASVPVPFIKRYRASKAIGGRRCGWLVRISPTRARTRAQMASSWLW